MVALQLEEAWEAGCHIKYAEYLLSLIPRLDCASVSRVLSLQE